MPPRTRKETPEAILFVDESKPMLKSAKFDNDAIIKTDEPITLTSGMPEIPTMFQRDTLVGKFVNIVISGQCRYKNSEVLEHWGDYLKIRTDLRSTSLAEVTLIPWSAIEGVGIVGAR